MPGQVSPVSVMLSITVLTVFGQRVVGCEARSQSAADTTAAERVVVDGEPAALPDPTKDYGDNPIVVTPGAGVLPASPAGQGTYSGLSAAEVAEAVRERYQDFSLVPVSVVRFADVDVGDAEQLGLGPEQITYGDIPDVVIILEGLFDRAQGGLAPGAPSTGRYMLLVVDRAWGEYATTVSDDLHYVQAMML